MKEIIDQHRQKYPISFAEIKFYSSFEQILGKTVNDYSKEERKSRWNKCLEEFRSSGRNDLIEVWTEPGGDGSCLECVHYNLGDGWCVLMGLPSAVNPILSFQHALPGMACMGVGKQTKGQTELDL
ncbi:hypothetical protein MKJ01_05505 [Chryseobacterium sp. SSA4.19]|uniref:hypothetical protein n=1 Tax=Chryseobacterium sp. SSA4.19 TaxID=2919915 RepID=UPI001F4D5D4A|nr:hypothetical protein [Chryseobacterium sp. SSA4.19]MCJ8153217.1 hypothetical protein [Chryseobacterium sp. SSA4.19]